MLVLLPGCLLAPFQPLAGDASSKAEAEPLAKPQRIVSLNLCTDQILFELVDRKRIAAMFYLTADPKYSNISADVQNIPLIRGGAEEVMRLKADLVLAGPYTTKATVALLKRLGHRVVIIPVATRFENIAQNIQLIASSVGEEARGAGIIYAFRKRLRQLKSRVGRARPLAAVIYTNNYTASPGSLAAEVLRHAGYRNLGAIAGGGGRSTLGLEDIIFNRPDLLIFGHSPKSYRTRLGDNLRHPVLAGFFAKQQRLEIAERLWLCGTPHTLDALEQLIDARRSTSGQGGGDGSP